MNYEEAVAHLRKDAAYTELIHDSYLDADLDAAAQRFADSDEFRETNALLAPEKGMTILDLGAGNGIASFAFSQAGLSVIAVDPDESRTVGLGAIEELKAKHGLTVETLKGFAEILPLADASVDRIYSRQAWHHFSDLKAAAKECYRVLKPNGRIVAAREHVIDDEAGLAQFLDCHVMQKLHGGEYAHLDSDYAGALSNAGFKNVMSIGVYESVINYFPTKPENIQRELEGWLGSRISSPLAKCLIRVPAVRESIARKLSHYNRMPGRLHSYTSVK